MTPYVRVPYHGPIVTGAQDQDNFVRNLLTVLTGYPWGAGVAGAAYRRPLPTRKSVAPVLTLTEIKIHCRIELDQTDEDALLADYEMAAHIHTQNVLRRDYDATVGENIRLAMLVLIAHWYRHREAIADETMNMVPLAYLALLSPERDFTYAFGDIDGGPPPVVIEGPPGPAGPPGPPAAIAYGMLELAPGTLPIWPQTATLLDIQLDIPATGQYAVEVRCGLTIDASNQDDVVTMVCNGRQQSMNFGKTQGAGGALSEVFAYSIPAAAGAFPLKLDAGAAIATPYFGAGDGTNWTSYVQWAAAEIKP